ncbi:hypothetical protein SUGI_0671620 [Cryptomeria japonica]|nr:hypothetical protein SUGI_0671620 [Cryptomeria japonica]
MGIRAFVKNTKLFLQVIRSMTFGDQSSVLQVYANYASDRLWLLLDVLAVLLGWFDGATASVYRLSFI